MSKFTTLGMREVFENAKQLLHENGYNVKRAKLTQSVLRSDVAMSANSTKFHVPIVVNDQQNGNAFPQEKRLQLQDVFIVSAVAILNNVNGGELYSYPNLLEYTTGGAAASLRKAFSNGNLSMIIDNDQVLPFYPLNWHYRAPITQAAENGYFATGAELQDSRDGSTDSIIQIEPNFILAGNAQIDANINLPEAMAAIQANSRFTVLFYGLLAQNCSKIAS